MTMRRLRERIVRVGFAIVAVLFLCSDLLAFVHQADGEHVVCAEHGELVHAEGASERVAMAGDSGHALEAVPPHEDREDADEHCRSCAASLDAPTVPVAAVLPRAVLPGVHEPNPLAAWPDTARGVLHLAPKTSPPSA